MLSKTMELLKKYSDLECSHWPEGVWHDCCVKHDYEYADNKGKIKADWNLLVCVAKKGRPLMGLIMFLGVSIGGWKPYLEYKRERASLKGVGE